MYKYRVKTIILRNRIDKLKRATKRSRSSIREITHFVSRNQKCPIHQRWSTINLILLQQAMDKLCTNYLKDQEEK